jgi:hypothetical protein
MKDGLRATTPSAPTEVLRDIFLLGADTPPHEEGNKPPLQRKRRFVHTY